MQPLVIFLPSLVTPHNAGRVAIALTFGPPAKVVLVVALLILSPFLGTPKMLGLHIISARLSAPLKTGVM